MSINGMKKGAVSFDVTITGIENITSIFIMGIMSILAGRPYPIPDPAKFNIQEHFPLHPPTTEEFKGTLEISWIKKGDNLVFSGKILTTGNEVLASFQMSG